MSLVRYLAFASAAMAIPIPQAGMELIMGPGTTGVFGAGPATSAPAVSAGALAGMASVIGMVADSTGGSGPYKSHFSALEGLPNHTVYQPKEPPAGEKLPVIVWGNGACSGNGAWFSKFLNEIASHGFFIIANGAPSGGLASQSKANDLPDAIDWVSKNGGTGKYAHVDKTKIAAAGQSCGGIQAYSASLDPRVSLTGIFNSGLISAGNTPKFEELHGPVGYFLGGPSDIAYENGVRDYKNLPKKIKSVLATLPVGHMATYGDAYGGQFGKAAVAFFKWQMKGDEAAGKKFLDPSSSPFTKAGWKIESKGWA
jgi:hypothetical protein